MRYLDPTRIRPRGGPGDVAIVGFDDLPMAAFLPVPLTTVVNPAAPCGEQAAHLLLGRLDGDKGPARQIALEPALVVRRSA